MKSVNLIGVLFALDSEKNENIRKNDIKKLKLLVNENGNLPSICYEEGDMKEKIRDFITETIGEHMFHLEQVYTFSTDKSVDILYLIAMNASDVILSEDYKLVDYSIKDNKKISLGENEYKYKTIEKEIYNSIEYSHELDVKDEELKKLLMYTLICYKRLRSNIDNTDILFKFMGSSFTLEDVRMVYELIKDASVDKSNFRKKIIKYCEKLDESVQSKNGFRPSQRYRFKPLKGDIWL